MQKRFIELLSAFVAELGIDCPIVPGENTVALPVGSTSINIGLFQDRGAIVMQSTAGVLPSAGREAFALELLRMNSLFRASQGVAYGLEDDAVTVQSIIYMEGLTQEAFTAQAAAFLEALAAALEGFSSIAERADAAPAASDADLLAMQNMLRI